MKIKILICCILIGLLVLSSVIIYQDNKIKDSENKYQGPVPERYDEPYFRETGITKPLENR